MALSSLLKSHKSNAVYHKISSRDNSFNEDTEKGERSKSVSSSGQVNISSNLVSHIILAVYFLIFSGLLSLTVAITNSSSVSWSQKKCESPTIRREWRSLSVAEKNQYRTAVSCLRTRPSRLRMEHSLYDDFPWVHNKFGAYSHEAAAFVVWHRRFIHVYEQTLRDDCGYAGSLPYWDWTLDWQDITKAPVWDSITGFGGSGNTSLEPEIMEGHCVTDGPFANLQVLYVKEHRRPHCLARGFVTKPELAELAEGIRPSAVEQLMREDDFEKFNLELEHLAHNSIPRAVRGDFLIFTAPYDPVFFLHHTQLDRLWMKWQQIDPTRRLHQFHGSARRNSTQTASASDLVPMGGLAPDLRVSQLLDTHGQTLCYSY